MCIGMVYCLTYSTPWLCFNISIERMEVNVVLSVMMGASLHLTGSGQKEKKFFRLVMVALHFMSMVVKLVGQ